MLEYTCKLSTANNASRAYKNYKKIQSRKACMLDRDLVFRSICIQICHENLHCFMFF